MVSRFREEVRLGHDRHEAVARSVEKAGRTVIFSGVTVAASLAVLLLMPFDFFRSFGYAGIAVVIGGVVGAVVVLPAVLAAVGDRVLPRRHDGGERHVLARPGRPGHAQAADLRRSGDALVLLLLGSPFLGLRFGVADDRILPAVRAGAADLGGDPGGVPRRGDRRAAGRLRRGRRPGGRARLRGRAVPAARGRPGGLGGRVLRRRTAGRRRRPAAVPREATGPGCPWCRRPS